MIYAFFIFSLYICSFLETGKNVPVSAYGNKIVHMYLFAFFVILAGCRYKTGYDWNAYMSFFEKINDGNSFGRMEVGYAALNYAFKNIFNSYDLMQFAICLSCTAFLFFFLKKYSPFPVVSLLVYASDMFFSYNLGLTRQFIAISILLLCADAVIEGKKMKASLCICAAFLFHKSAIIAVLFFLCDKVHLKKITMVILVLASMLLNLFGYRLVWQIVYSLFSLPFLPSFIGKYAGYMTNIIFSQQGEFNSGMGYLLRIFLVLLVMVFRKNNSRCANFIFNAVLTGLFIQAFGRNIQIISRLAAYFSVFETVFFAYLYEVMRKKARPASYPVFAMFLTCYFLIAPYNRTQGVMEQDGKSRWALYSPWIPSFYKTEISDRNNRMRIINGF
ncbi:MAG: EpsG family protein [Treponema sp.]|nr:EpsG family protein [Treponema sp.]